MLEIYRSEVDSHRHVFRVLEVGVWKGGTLKEWLRVGNLPRFVVAVDDAHRNEKEYTDWVQPGSYLDVVKGMSQDDGVVSRARGWAPYDWVFIDADHAYSSVKADVDNYMPMVRPGGLLLLHDIAPNAESHNAYPGLVLAELEELGYAVKRIVDSGSHPVSHGIGVVKL